MSREAGPTSMGTVSTPYETPRLVRRKDHRLFAGVAGGLADHFGVSPAWFRLGFAISFFVAGSGLAAYLLLWFLIPRLDLPSSAAQRMAGPDRRLRVRRQEPRHRF